MTVLYWYSRVVLVDKFDGPLETVVEVELYGQLVEILPLNCLHLG
jgi:hypothetical protein